MRNPSAPAATDLAKTGAELVPGSLQDPPSLGRLVQGADFLFHCAGAVRGANYRDFETANVQGTAHLLDALAPLPAPPRTVMLSSIVAREPQLSWYSRSKREAEGLLSKTARAAIPPVWTLLRPPAVYGPGDREMLPVFKAMARGMVPVPGAVEARNSLIHVDDLVRACLACVQADAARGRTFELHDGTEGGYSWGELAELAGRVHRRTVRPLRIPGPLLNAVAGLNLLRARLTGAHPMLTPAKLRELRHPDWVADNRAITAATGWWPTITLEQGLAALG